MRTCVTCFAETFDQSLAVMWSFAVMRSCSWVLDFVVSIVIVLMLVNMLIAMISKTFDDISGTPPQS